MLLKYLKITNCIFAKKIASSQYFPLLKISDMDSLVIGWTNSISVYKVCSPDWMYPSYVYALAYCL